MAAQKSSAHAYGRNEAWVKAAPSKLGDVNGYERREVLGGKFGLYERIDDTVIPADVLNNGKILKSSHSTPTLSAGQSSAVSTAMGGPKCLTPSSATQPSLALAKTNLSGLALAHRAALAESRGSSESLWVSLDTEYVGVDGTSKRTKETRSVASWQVAFCVGGKLVEWVIAPRTTKPLLLDNLLGLICDRANMPASTYSTVTSSKGSSKVDITLMCFAALADITTFKGSKTLLPLLCRSGNALFTGVSSYRCKATTATVAPHRSHNQFWDIRVRVRDCKSFCAADTSLRMVGEAVELPKLNMSKDDYRNMVSVRDLEPERFFAYALRDVEIVYRYMAAMLHTINEKIKPTIPSLSAAFFRSQIRIHGGEVEGKPSWSMAEYEEKYRGIKKVTDGIEMDDSQNFVVKEHYEPINVRAQELNNLAQSSYRGGINASLVIGHYDGPSTDWDLCGAYPVGIGCILDPDYSEPFAAAYENEEITLQSLPLTAPWAPGFGVVDFEFPPDTYLPCISIKTKNGLVFPLSSKGLDGVPVTLPEIYLALKMGAKIFAHRFVIATCYQRSVGLAAMAYKDLITARKQDAVLYGKKSVQALGDKLLNNAGYGKLAQDVAPKSARSLKTLDMEDRGTSVITNAPIASMGTAIVRCALIASINELKQQGYMVYSVTTDGEITNAPDDVVERLPLMGFVERMSQIRMFYTDGTESNIWEPKHRNDGLFNFTTRGNVAPNVGGVIARDSFKGFRPEELGIDGDGKPIVDVSEDSRCEFIELLVTRTRPLPYTVNEWVSAADMLRYDEDFHTYEVRKTMNPNFDFKRLPDNATLRDEPFSLAGKSFTTACYDTLPFETMEDFHAHKKTVGKHQLLCAADYVKAEYRASHYCPRAKSDTDYVRYAVTAHRKGDVDIPALSRLKGKQCLKFINSFIHSGREFTENDWKNCGRQERKSTLPPASEWQAWANKMIAAS